MICDLQEKHNKDELTKGAGGRIKEVEENLDDQFAPIGESLITGRLRVQEGRHQKASAVLSDKVSIIVMYLIYASDTHKENVSVNST